MVLISLYLFYTKQGHVNMGYHFVLLNDSTHPKVANERPERKVTYFKERGYYNRLQVES